MREEEEGETETGNQGKKDTVAVNTIGTGPNSPLAYAPVLENHQPIMSTIGGHGGLLER